LQGNIKNQAQWDFGFPKSTMTADSPSPLPSLGAATLLRALFKRPRRLNGVRTPRTTYVLDRIDADQLRRYRQALGFRDDGIPVTYYYLLAQRAHVATMLDDAFPFRLPGTVHTENALRALAEPRRDVPLVLSTTVNIRPPAENGAVYAELDTVARQQGTDIFTCRSTYLVVRGQAGRKRRQDARDLPVLTGWRLARNTGRAYARISGDWNPIHLWTWSARLMGMRRPIVHGMHTLARACAELEQACGRRILALEGRFRAPAALGSELVLGADLASGSFAVGGGGGRIVAEGSFRTI
jgi:acyl dehydratase